MGRSLLIMTTGRMERGSSIILSVKLKKKSQPGLESTTKFTFGLMPSTISSEVGTFYMTVLYLLRDRAVPF